MSLIEAITSTEQTVAVSKRCRIHGVWFSSDDEDLHVKLLDGGALGTGTVKFYILIDATTALGDERFIWVAGDPKGAMFEKGLNVNITKDGSASAGTGTINVEYTPE